MFLRDYWYVAAWSADITRDPLARMILGEPICMYRTEDGKLVAVADRCPHRNLPMSRGKVLGDDLQCGYHGLQFDTSGRCVRAPGETKVPSWCNIRSYPMIERHGWSFIWMGDADQASIDSVPDFHHHLADPEWGYASGQLRVEAGYKLLLDNLLDLSHLAYVHSSTTGNADVGETADIVVSSESDTHVRQTRIMRDVAAAPAYDFYGDYSGANMDRWQCTNYYSPSYIYINNGSRVPEANDDFDPAVDMAKWGFRVYHALTPETETSTHQFWAVPYRKDMVDACHDDLWQKQMANVLDEDHDVYIHQQRLLVNDPLAVDDDARPDGALKGDKGLYRVRLILKRLQEAEADARDYS